MPPLKIPTNLRFGPFDVTSQVFHVSPSQSSFALVNLKPLLPGHVLETADLFQTVQRVSKTIERVYAATALNVAVQDGVDAGQSVPHVHVHIIPRQKDDLTDRGGNDKIYDMMDGDDGNLGKDFLEMQRIRQARSEHRKFAGPDSERKPRSEQEMNEEAAWLHREVEQDENLVSEEE